MNLYNNIQYGQLQLQLQRPFDTYTPNLSKSVNNNHNKQNITVNNWILFYINIHVTFFLQRIGQMTPITNISIPPSTNVIMTAPQPALTYTSSGILHKQKQQSQTDLSINKPPSSTLVDLLKQRRSPPPPPPPRSIMSNNSLSLTARQQKQNSIVKQPKKPSKKSQIQAKRVPVNNDNNIRIDVNPIKLFYLKMFFLFVLFLIRISQVQMKQF